MGAENFAHTGIRSPDRPAHSESLYRLRYPGPTYEMGTEVKISQSTLVLLLHVFTAWTGKTLLFLLLSYTILFLITVLKITDAID
jgi:hypothetical protein